MTERHALETEAIEATLTIHEQELLRSASRGTSPARMAALYRQYKDAAGIEAKLKNIAEKILPAVLDDFSEEQPISIPVVRRAGTELDPLKVRTPPNTPARRTPPLHKKLSLSLRAAHDHLSPREAQVVAFLRHHGPAIAKDILSATNIPHGSQGYVLERLQRNQHIQITGREGRSNIYAITDTAPPTNTTHTVPTPQTDKHTDNAPAPTTPAVDSASPGHHDPPRVPPADAISGTLWAFLLHEGRDWDAEKTQTYVDTVRRLHDVIAS